MRTFRGKKVIGWRTIVSTSVDFFDRQLNTLMDEYEFVDCQFSTTKDTDLTYFALVLLGEKE